MISEIVQRQAVSLYRVSKVVEGLELVGCWLVAKFFVL